MRLQLTGQRFGRLVVLGEGAHTAKNSRWRCLCDCGNPTETYGFALRDGTTQSCGCLGLQRLKEGRETHGATHTPEYKVWESMRQRCRNPSHPSYKNYGAKGIGVCKHWEKFENFLVDMGEKPTPEHSIERKNSKLGYSKRNCCWATRKDQNNNTSRNRYLVYKGQRKTLAQWSDWSGVGYNTLTKRLQLGWPLAKAFDDEPSNPRNSAPN